MLGNNQLEFIKSDVEYIEGALAQEEFMLLLYQNNNISECCARMNIHPAAVAAVMNRNPEFKAAVQAAQAWQADLKVDTLENIHDEIDNPLMARVISDNRKWVAAKRAKERYGDKLDIAVTHTIDLKSAIAEARARSLPFIDGKSLELNDTVTAITTVESVDLETLDVFA